jgi:hypothetical protein
MKTVTRDQVGHEELALPARVQEALGELVSSAKEGLFASSVGVGLGVLAELMEEKSTRLSARRASTTRSAHRRARARAGALQHRESSVRPAHQALLDEGLERVQVGACDLLGRLERAAAGEDCKAREEPMFFGAEQAAAPRDRLPQRLLAFRQISRTAGQQREPWLQPVPEGGQAEDRRAACRKRSSCR